MDPRLLRYYEQELHYLREVGGEFAREFPKIAGHLGLTEFECADPYVERLLEGSALLSGRVQLKMDAEFPRFTEHILEMVCPQVLAPTPSIAVLQLEPSRTLLTGGFVVPRNTRMKAKVERALTEVTYCTRTEVELWPLEISGLRHTQFFGDIGEFRLDDPRGIKSTLRLRIRTTNGAPLSEIPVEQLPLFVRGHDAHAMKLYELLLSASVGIAVIPAGAERGIICPNGRVKSVGLSPEEAVLPTDHRTFSGHRLLQEYFALPARFLFVGLEGLAAGLRDCATDEAELVIFLDRHDSVVEPSLETSQLALFCVPAVNLFEHTADRIHLSYRDHEHHVVPDRTKPLDMEVYSIESVVGHGAGSAERYDFRALFGCTDRTSREGAPAYYTVHREPRRLSSKEKREGSRSSYGGTETYLALTDGQSGAFPAEMKQLTVRTMCTNRDLPLAINTGGGTTDFVAESGAPLDSIRCVAGPSRPLPALSGGERSWRLINHVSLNYLSLTNSTGGNGAEALRELLGLYAEQAEPGIRRHVDGVLSVGTTAVIRRLPGAGPVTFARGLRVDLGCDESAFEGAGAFLFGTVLERFFTGYASINSLVETVLSTRQRGSIMHWPARVGGRPAL